MKQILLQRIVAILMLCFFFQDIQAQITDDGKFPNRVPMIENIVIFNQNLTDYILNAQPQHFGSSNITGESGVVVDNPNITEIVANEVVDYTISSKDLLIDKAEENELDAEIIENEEGNTSLQVIRHRNSSFSFETLAELVVAYPNPVQNTLTIEVKDNLSLNIRLINMLGQVVYAQNSTNVDKVQIDVLDFAKGAYILDIRSNTERVSQKIQIVR